jgi:hypothetical protein
MLYCTSYILLLHIFVETVIHFFFNPERHTSDRQDNGLVTRKPDMAAASHHASDMHFFGMSLVHLPMTGILAIISDRHYQ